jgi:hypothetical protein
MYTAGIAAACSKLAAAGLRQTCRRGTTTCELYPPNRVTATTSSPAARSRTPSPTAPTVPLTSNPGVIGQPTYCRADEYSPIRTITSA